MDIFEILVNRFTTEQHPLRQFYCGSVDTIQTHLSLPQAVIVWLYTRLIRKTVWLVGRRLTRPSERHKTNGCIILALVSDSV
jgi:hypothetical protein